MSETNSFTLADLKAKLADIATKSANFQEQENILKSAIHLLETDAGAAGDSGPSPSPDPIPAPETDYDVFRRETPEHLHNMPGLFEGWLKKRKAAVSEQPTVPEPWAPTPLQALADPATLLVDFRGTRRLLERLIRIGEAAQSKLLKAELVSRCLEDAGLYWGNPRELRSSVSTRLANHPEFFEWVAQGIYRYCGPVHRGNMAYEPDGEPY